MGIVDVAWLVDADSASGAGSEERISRHTGERV